MKTKKELIAIRTVLTKRADELCKEHEQAALRCKDDLPLGEQVRIIKDALPVSMNVYALIKQAALITFLLE